MEPLELERGGRRDPGDGVGLAIERLDRSVPTCVGLGDSSRSARSCIAAALRASTFRPSSAARFSREVSLKSDSSNCEALSSTMAPYESPISAITVSAARHSFAPAAAGRRRGPAAASSSSSRPRTS